MSTTFYSYLYLRKNGTPYYVGKGCGERAFSRNRIFLPPKDRSRIVIFPMESEKLAFESEKALIELFGRKDLGTGILRNLTNGGEGASNPSPEINRKRGLSISRAKTGVSRPPYSQEWRDNISAGKKGRISNKQKEQFASVRYTGGRTTGRFPGNTNGKRPALKFCALGGQRGTHSRWHVARQIVCAECALCQR